MMYYRVIDGSEDHAGDHRMPSSLGAQRCPDLDQMLDSLDSLPSLTQQETGRNKRRPSASLAVIAKKDGINKRLVTLQQESRASTFVRELRERLPTLDTPLQTAIRYAYIYIHACVYTHIHFKICTFAAGLAKGTTRYQP